MCKWLMAYKYVCKLKTDLAWAQPLTLTETKPKKHRTDVHVPKSYCGNPETIFCLN